MTRNTPFEGQYGQDEGYERNTPYDNQGYSKFGQGEGYERDTSYENRGNEQYGSYPQRAPAPLRFQPQSQYGSNDLPYEQYDQRPPEPPYASRSPVYGSESRQEQEYDQPYGEQGYAPPQGPPPQYTGAESGADGDRGIMGALAGGAAGIYAGHKVHHGFLGGVGGAVAGSMLEDAYKKHEKEKKEEERREHLMHEAQEHHLHDHHHHHREVGPPPPMMAGNFLASSRNVRIEEHCVLVADCQNIQGNHYRSALDLNDCLTNTHGRLAWARGGMFGFSSRSIRVVDGGEVLEAELEDGNGTWVPNRIWLNERITNMDGCLRMVD